jgi:HEAT repeat protein
MESRPAPIRALLTLSAAALIAAACSDSARMQRQLTSEHPVERAAAAESLGVWGAHDALHGLRAALDDSIPGVRERVVSALGRIGGAELTPLIAGIAVNDPDPGVRRSAAHSLARADAPRGIEVIHPLLRGPTPTVQLRAVEACTDILRASNGDLPQTVRGEIGATLGDLVRSVQVKRAELPGNWRAWSACWDSEIAPDDTIEVVADQAVIALAWLGGAEAGRGLMEAFGGLLAPNVKDSALATIVIRDDTTLIGAIVAQLGTNVVSSRLRAVQVLGGIPHPHAAEALLGATSDRASDVRRAAWIGLARIHGGQVLPDSERIGLSHRLALSEPVRAAAQKALQSRIPFETIGAAVLLHACDAVDDPAAVAEAVARHSAAVSGDSVCSIALYRALEVLPGGQRDIPSVAAAIEPGFTARSVGVRAAAVRASGKWVAPYRRGVILGALRSYASAAMIRAALIAIRHMHSSDYTAEVLNAFGADSATRIEAARTMAALAYDNAQAVRYLVLMLSNIEPDRRHTAVEAIGILASQLRREETLDSTAPALQAAIPWLAQMAHEEEVAANRAHALWALGYLPSYETNEALGVGLDDPSEEVRIAAAEGLIRLRGDVALSAVRPLAFGASEEGRLRIVSALSGMQTARAQNLLREISVRDPSPRVRWAARPS